MATPAEVEAAVRALVRRLADVEPELRRRLLAERTVSCRVHDLGLVYSAQLGEDGLTEVTLEAAERAQVRLVVSSDDLLAMADGRLRVSTAWATARLRVQAGPLDLLKLRALL